jgi:RNA-directed DNA polymerase
MNPIIRGWGNYFRTGVSKKVFAGLDHYQFQRQVRFAKRKHPNKSAYWKEKKYWGKIEGRNDKWVFMDKETGAYMQKFSWIPIQRHILVVKDSSPDDPALKSYWENRMKRNKSLLTSKGVRQKLFNIQKGKCPICNQPLINLEETGQEELHIHHVKARKQDGSNKLDNLKLIHLYCHQQEHSNAKS